MRIQITDFFLLLYKHNTPCPLSCSMFVWSLSAAHQPSRSSRLSITLSQSYFLHTFSCLSSLELTVPEGRGHLRTKWGISRQLCAHSLRWPSIIHSLLPPPSLHLHSALFISPHGCCLYLSHSLFFTEIACHPIQRHSPQLSSSLPPPPPLFPLLPFPFLLFFSSEHHSIILFPHLLTY